MCVEVDPAEQAQLLNNCLHPPALALGCLLLKESTDLQLWVGKRSGTFLYLSLLSELPSTNTIARLCPFIASKPQPHGVCCKRAFQGLGTMEVANSCRQARQRALLLYLCTFNFDKHAAVPVFVRPSIVIRCVFFGLQSGKNHPMFRAEQVITCVLTHF